MRYRIPRGRLRNFKEVVLLWLRRRLAFDEFWALRDIDIRVAPGERLGVVGRNGAGKSTLLQIMARVLTPTTGRAYVRGRVAPLLQLGAGFDPELTGRENVFLNASLLGMRRADVISGFDEIIRFAELEAFVDAPLRAYSTGMAARLGFAVATAARPDILLLDEILAVGDEAFQTKCLARMRDFAAQGTTMVVVTHDPAFLLRYATHVVWIDEHVIRAEGEPSYVLDLYHAFMAERTRASESTEPAPPIDGLVPA